jgi:kumamolisin
MSKLFARLLLVALAVLFTASAPAAASTLPNHGNRASTLLSAGGAVPLGPLESDQTLALSLVLRGQAPGELARLLVLISTPRSPWFHHYLTSAEIAQRFGISSGDRRRIEAALRTANLPLPSYSEDGLLASLHVTVVQAEAFFAVRLSRYRAKNGRVYYAPDRPPRLPASLNGVVVGVLGLDQRVTLAGHAEFAPQSGLVSGVTGLSPSDIDRAYDVGPLQQYGLDGYNQTVALAEISTFNPSDIAMYDQQYNIVAPAVRVVPIGSGADADSPESTLDIELVHALAPHAHVVVYESPNDLSSVAEMVSQIVSDDQAHVLSISLGTCEAELDPSIATAFLTSLDESFSLASVEGMSVLVASGDSGAFDCQDSQLAVNAVAASPYVTSVGGTTLFLHTNGSYNYEAGWEGPLEEVGGGGGLSTLYQRPAWQLGPGVQNAYSDGMRQIPDVSADADPLTGYAVYYSKNGCGAPATCWQIIGGTSAATPLWASLILLIDQLAEQHGQRPLGLLNPLLYQLEAGPGSGVTAPLPFHDVSIGGNLYYDATPGWDYSTGWGSPDAAVLAQDIVHVQLG